MTRGGKNARSGVDRLEAHGRLRKARAYHRVAQDALPMLEAAALDRAPVLSNTALAAIAADGRVNLKDHATAPALVRDCLGAAVPEGRLADLRGILALKDEVQYGARVAPPAQAEQVLERLDRFAA